MMIPTEPIPCIRDTFRHSTLLNYQVPEILFLLNDNHNTMIESDWLVAALI